MTYPNTTCDYYESFNHSIYESFNHNNGPDIYCHALYGEYRPNKVEENGKNDVLNNINDFSKKIIKNLKITFKINVNLIS